MALEDGPTLKIGKHSYYVPQTPLTRLPAHYLVSIEHFEEEFIPTTAIVSGAKPLSHDDIESIYQSFDQQDDVWSRSFLSLTLLLQSPNQRKYPSETSSVLFLERSELKLSQGPYMVKRSTGEIFAAYRLYEDTHQAFLQAITHSNICLSDLIKSEPTNPEEVHVSVPVPSRLYFPTPDSNLPLAGLRFAVKDSIDLKGFSTGYGSTAYRATYPAVDQHAPCVQQLLYAGAVVIGIVKSSEFAEGTDPHEWTDSVCPVNPRGDGEQNPSSSSTGSAVAAAAYEWLDFTVGTDTGGSIRHPAGVNGLFGSRTTQGAIDLTGVLGATDLLNTVGVFARDASIFSDVGRQLLPSAFQPAVPFSGRKYKLLYPVRAPLVDSPNAFRWFPNPKDAAEFSDAEKQMEDFVERLEAHLGCHRVCFNLDELWQATRPRGQPESLDKAIGHIYSTLTTFFAVNTCIDQFYLDYASQNDGQEPQIAAVVKERQDHGRNLPSSQVAAALNSMHVFAEWVETVLFGAYDEEAIALMVFPQSFGIPNYLHNILPRGELFNDAFSIYAFGYLVGCPDYTVPIGEVPFRSDVTDEIEQLPVSVSMVARPGNDIPMFDILTSLEEAGLLHGVKAGTRMYD